MAALDLSYSIDDDSNDYESYVGPENKGIALPDLKFWGDGSWREEAKCKGVPTGVFFPDIGKPAYEAQSICMTCPSRLPCAEFALRNNIKCGTYGGLTPKDRRRLKADLITEADVMFPISVAAFILTRSGDENPVATLARLVGESDEWVEDKITNDGDYLI